MEEVSLEEITSAIKKTKLEKASGLLEVEHRNDKMDATKWNARTRMGWKKFKMCGEILFQKKILFADERKGVYRSYERSAMLYGSKTWFLRKNKVAILIKAEKFMVIATCSVKLVDKKNTEKLKTCWD